MTVLRQTLEGSRLLRPWVALAETSGATVARWLGNSRLLGRLARTPSPSSLTAGKLGLAFQTALWAGIAGLFVLLTFAGTGLIGITTWLLLAFCLLGCLLLKPAWFRHLNAVDVLVALFLASAALSTAFSSFFTTSVIGLAKMTTFVAGYAVFRVLSEQGNSRIAGLLAVLAALGLGEALIGLYQHINHIQPLATWTDPTTNPELQMNRIFGTLKPYNPNLLAGFLIPCFAAAAGSALLFFRKKTIPVALGFAASAMLILYALVLTGSRGGFLAIAVMLACMFAYVGHLLWHERDLKRYRWMRAAWLLILLASVLGLSAGILSSEKLRHRVTSIFAMREDSSISYRLNVYQSAAEMFQDNPVVGIGPGNGTFKLVYGLYMVPGYNALGAYSVPLEIAVEQGLIGLVIFLSLLLVLILRAALAFDAETLTLRQKLLVGALLTGILGSFTYGIFDTIWYRPSVNLLFWFMVAALARLTELPAHDASTSRSLPS